MHFLISQEHFTHKLVDYSDEIAALQQALMREKAEKVGVTPVILSQRVVRDTYLCNDFGVPVEDNGSLIKLDDL